MKRRRRTTLITLRGEIRALKREVYSLNIQLGELVRQRTRSDQAIDAYLEARLFIHSHGLTREFADWVLARDPGPRGPAS